jgi:protein-tyrosine phosphatase
MKRNAWICGIALSAAIALANPAWVKPAASVSAARNTRFVAIEGVKNFRDVGGYRTSDGRIVQWGMLYRSGALGGMTSQGRDAFGRLGVGSIIDLRSASERQHSPEDSLGSDKISYWTHDYVMGGGDPARPQSSPRTAEAVRSLMQNVYRTIPRDMAPSYRELFVRLGTGNGAVVLNCTAGKDRTGIGAALVLSALGVPYPAIRRDFLLSNVGVNPANLRPSLPPYLAALSDEALMPLAGVDGAYLDGTFTQLRHDYGSIRGYLQKELGVGPREIARLRVRMLK